MLTSDLYAVFSQLLTGTLTLVAIFVVLWLMRGDTRFIDYLQTAVPNGLAPFKVTMPESKDSWALAIALTLCALFGLGLTVQTAVDDFVDDTEMSSRVLAFPVRVMVGDETAYRFSALFAPPRQPDQESKTPSEGATEEKADTRPWKWLDMLPLLARRTQVADRCRYSRPYELTGLGRELLADWRAMEGIKPPVDVSFIDLYAARKFEKKDCEQAQRLARKLYYDALNFAIGRDVEGRLLARWQAQMDFLGGAVVLSVWSLCALVIYLICVRLRPGVARVMRKSGTPRPDEGKMKSVWFVFGVMLFGAYASGSGYVLAQKSYIERVFGFYSSQVGLQDVFRSDE